MYPLQQPVPDTTTLAVARGLGYLLVAAAGTGLVLYLRAYTRRILAPPFRDRWRYLLVGIAATVVYGVAGLAELAGTPPAEPFRRGATLFVFLFCALGVRAVFRSVGGEPLLSDATLRWLGPAVVAGFVAAWWAMYLFGGGAAVAALELAGLVITVAYTLHHAVRTVGAEEGTSIAAFTRQFVPALLALAAVAAAEHAAVFGGPVAAANGVAVVGTVLAGAFLFTTAVALRQQTGEVERMYDPTTWREEPVDGAD
jgi:hypothetical protein